MNCRSVINKIDEFAGLLDTVKADVVFGTESWLNPSISDHEVFPNNYTAYRKDRPNHGGGVFLLVHSSLSSANLDIGNDAVESVWSTVTVSNNFSFVAGTFYRPPAANSSILQLLGDIVSQASDRTILLAGDFNLPDLKWRSHSCEVLHASRNNLEMKNIVDTFGLIQYVLEPTRLKHTLDLLFCNSPNLVSNVDIIPGISDHQVVVAGVTTKIQKITKSIRRKLFFFDKGDYPSISARLLDYLPVFECLVEEHSVEYLWNTFKNKILELSEQYIPSMDSAKLKKRKKPWVTYSILKLIKKRRRVFKKYKKMKGKVHYKKLQELTREYKEESVNAKQHFFKRLNENMSTNPKPFWQYLKGCGSDPVGINELIFDGRTLSNDTDKATCLNNYFQSVFLPKSALSSPLPSSSVPLMEPLVISVSGIEALLRNLDDSKAIGPDGVSPRVLKQCVNPISLYLYLIFEKSLSTGQLPQDWKVANVVPIHKGGPKKDVTNYRPISLTSISCKIIEHVIYKALMKHLLDYDLLTKTQHGFRKGFSCTTQLLEFYNDLVSEIDLGGQTDCIFLDFSKAFDTVSHPLLLEKLRIFNIDERIFNWIENYLSQRRQCVVLNGTKSEFLEVTSGVPQGSVLGPLLFIIFINDINKDISSSIRLFADDCVVYRKIQKEHDVLELQADLARIHQWCLKWQMKLNTNKCVHVCFTKKKKIFDANFCLGGNKLDKKYSYKYLGVLLSHDCSWNAHVDYVVSKAAIALNYIQRNLRCADPNLRSTAYLTCIRPILEYACTLWDPTQTGLINKLEKIQNRAARFVLGRYGQKQSCTEMKKELNWELLSSRRKKLRLKLLYQIFHKKTGLDSDTYLKRPDYISQRTDHIHKIKPCRARTNLYSNSFFVKTINEWNCLTSEQVCSVNEDVFFSTL